MVIPREARRITYSTEIRDLKKRLSLSDYQRSVVVGSLLGDANLTANWSKTNFSLQFTHSIKQKNYVAWKYRVLKDWFLSPPRYYARNQSLTIKTVSHPEITLLSKLFYRDGKKVLPDSIANIIRDQVSVAIWFMDDGNIIKRNGKIYGYHLNTQSFTREENDVISRTLYKIHGIENLLEKNHDRYRIRIMKKESRSKFQNIIRQYMLPDMKYKLG